MDDMEKTYPKVLIINTQSLNMNFPTGITLRSFFANWPRDRIFEIYQWKTKNIANDEILIPSEQIPIKTIPAFYWLRKLSHKECEYETTSFGEAEKTKKDKGRFKTEAILAIKMISEFSPICFTNKEFLKKIDEFSPDVIYTYAFSVYINRIVLFFSKRYNINITIHYMDNWRESIFMDNKFTKILNYLLNRTVKRMEKRMRMGLTISKKMADHYKAEYGADYAVLMNCVDFPESRTNVAYKEKNIIKFVYAGGMPIGRHEQLIEVQNSILSFNSEHTTISATLIIYTSNRDRNSYSMLFDSKITEFRDYVPHENVGKVYEEADVLIYTESFEKSMVEYTKYSMSTKIPEYMSSGKPILCYAPETIAVYEYIKAEQTGICAKNKTDLNEAVKVLVTSPEKRKYFGENGIETAKKNHSKNKAEAVLREVLAYNTKASNRN